MVRFLYFIFIMFCLAPQVHGSSLTLKDTQQLKQAKYILREVDKRSIEALTEEFSASGSTRGMLHIYNAIALTFKEIIEEFSNKYDKTAKKRLLQKIQMNMAYFQLGGADIESAKDSELDILIRRKLKEHLPINIWNNPKLFHSLE